MNFFLHLAFLLYFSKFSNLEITSQNNYQKTKKLPSSSNNAKGREFPHVVPPQFIDTSQYQTQKVLSYFCTVTGASPESNYSQKWFRRLAQRCVQYICLCALTNRTLSDKHPVSTLSFHSLCISIHFLIVP